MDIFDGSYYYINKSLLKTWGLWPYLSKSRKNISLLIVTIGSVSIIIPLVAGILRAWGKNILEVYEDCIGILYFGCIYLKYASLHFFEDQMKKVYEQVAVEYKKITDINEKVILNKYLQQGKFITILGVCYGTVLVFIYYTVTIFPLLLDLVIPKNSSRSYIYPWYADYLIIDEDKYHYQLFSTHGLFVIIMSTGAYVTIDTVFIVIIQHVCGLFAIVCHRLYNIGEEEKEEKVFQNFISDKKMHKIMKAIFINHDSSLKIFGLVQNVFSFSLLTLYVCALLGIPLLMFDAIRLGMAITGAIICIYLLNLIGDHLQQNSESVFASAYNNKWYCSTSNAQRYLNIIMLRSIVSCRLTAGGFFNLNLPTFASVMKTIASYATVILSMQNDVNK